MTLQHFQIINDLSSVLHIDCTSIQKQINEEYLGSIAGMFNILSYEQKSQELGKDGIIKVMPEYESDHSPVAPVAVPVASRQTHLREQKSTDYARKKESIRSAPPRKVTSSPRSQKPLEVHRPSTAIAGAALNREPPKNVEKKVQTRAVASANQQLRPTLHEPLIQKRVAAKSARTDPLRNSKLQSVVANQSQQNDKSVLHVERSPSKMISLQERPSSSKGSVKKDSVVERTNNRPNVITSKAKESTSVPTEKR